MSPRTIDLYPDLAITVHARGQGRPVLVLHGGGGPGTVAGLAAHLAGTGTARAIVPTHPGWEGTTRPEWLTGVDDLALAYLHLIQDMGLRDVLVIGSSLGGWVGAEMAVRDNAGVITGLVIIDGAGVLIPDEPMVDFFALDPRGIAEHSWHDPDRYFVDPATVPAEQAARMRAGIATLRVLAGDPYMHDPKLLRRLGRVTIPTRVIWGESDRVFTPGYGAAYAAAFPNAEFHTVPKAGHLPHIEQPEETYALIAAVAQ